MADEQSTLEHEHDVPFGDLLLTTKLYIPRPRPNLVPRPRLTERLDAGLKGAITLISAPAGFGKTTLISEWRQGASGRDRLITWLSLDENDSEPVRFWTYVIASLRTLQPGLGENILDLLRIPQLPPVETLMTLLINEVAAIPEDFVLVLDDYHVITSQSIHVALAFLLEHLPARMHLVIAGRADPPLPLARLRARGRLTELRADDLRFTPGEIAVFLNQSMGLGLSADDIAALGSRTEGWIAGLHLAALSMRGAKDISAFIRDFTGSHHFILDYLVEEVVHQQPEHVQDFLMQTAILERLSGPLCDAVTAQSGSQAMLEALERANLFIVPLDNERRWYRYHHLFAELLTGCLHEAQPELVPELHRRASAWYQQNGLTAAAIEHAFSARDYDRAADLVERIAETTLMRSEVSTFQGWVGQLPDEMVLARPSLCVFHAWALLLTGGSLRSVESRIPDVTDETGLVSNQVIILQALLAAVRGQADRAAELSRQAIAQQSQENLFLRSVAAFILGISSLQAGDMKACTQALDQAAEMSLQTGNIMVAVMSLCHQAEVNLLLGKLHEAEEIYQQALELAVDQHGRSLPISGMPRIGLGYLKLERNDLDTAVHYLEQGIELAVEWGEIGALEGYLWLASLQQAQGEVQAAQETIHKAQHLAEAFDATEMDDLIVSAFQARLWLAQGNLDEAERWLHEGPAGLQKEIYSVQDLYLHWSEYTTRARVLIALGRAGEALPLLERLLNSVEALDWGRSEIEILILQAAALHVQGETDRAAQVLMRALALAQPQGYVRMFVDAGIPLRDLLLRISRMRVEESLSEYVNELLAAFDGQRAERPERQPTQPDLPPLLQLTGRELEVLNLLAAGLSGPEVADELIVSVSTVRTHIKNIYQKLDAHNRVQAIERARTLDLLPQ